MPLFARDYVLQDGGCNHECKDGYYNQDGICKPCINHCYRCSNSKQCDECSNGWVLFDDKCVDICPDGYIKGDKKCIPWYVLTLIPVLLVKREKN